MSKTVTVTVTATPEWIAGDIVAMSQRISSTAERDNIVKMLTGYLTRVSRTPAESAADDLLAACKVLLDAIHDSMTHAAQAAHAKQIDAARSAIARAEGGAQ